MKLLAINKYFRFFITFTKFRLQSAMIYRMSFFIEFMIEIGYIVWTILFYQILFRNVDAIAGWTKNEVLFLIGLNIVFSEILVGLFYVWNLRMLPGRINDGDIDFLLLKPVDSQFILTASQPYISSFFSTIVGFYLMYVSGSQLQLTITLPHLISGSFIFICGLIIAYAFMTMVTSLAFIFPNASFLPDVASSIYQYGSNPHTIYRGVFRLIFTFVVPIIFFASIPTQAFLSGVSGANIILVTFLAVIFLILSRLVWKRMILRYSSASS